MENERRIIEDIGYSRWRKQRSFVLIWTVEGTKKVKNTVGLFLGVIRKRIFIIYIAAAESHPLSWPSSVVTRKKCKNVSELTAKAREREREKIFSSIVIKRKYSFHFPPRDIDYIEERWVSSKIKKKIPRKIRQMPIRNSIAIEYALRCGRFVEIEIFLATSREMKAKQKFVSFFINTITNASFLQFSSKIKYSSRNSINIYFSTVRNVNCEWNRDFFQHLLRAFFNLSCVRKLQSWIIQEKLQNT